MEDKTTVIANSMPDTKEMEEIITHAIKKDSKNMFQNTKPKKF